MKEEKRARELRTLAKYTLASLGCTGVDFLLFTLLTHFLNPFFSYVFARVVSASLNYQIVRRRVFQKEGSYLRGAKYFALAVGSMIVGSVLTQLLSGLSGHLTVIKLLVDIALYFANFFVQHLLIFK